MTLALRSLPTLAFAAALLFAAPPAQALLHTINFSDSSVTGSFDVDSSLLIPGNQVSCNSGPPCGFNSFLVTFDSGEFTLADLPGEVLNGRVGAGGFVESLFVLMEDNTGSASGAFLEMFRDPNTFNINPSGSYTISVPEPATSGLLAFSLVGVAVALRRRR